MLLVTSAKMREIDDITINEYGIPGTVLMENAGRGAFSVLLKTFPNIGQKRVVVVCGKGNNGGDGYVIARYLVNRGISVGVICLEPQTEITGDARVHLNILINIGADIRCISQSSEMPLLWDELKKADIIVDAIFGTGLSSKVRGRYEEIIDMINRASKEVFAVDIPSGIDANTGKILGCAVRAQACATFGLAKVGHKIEPGASHTGELTIVDIGIPKKLFNQVEPIFSTIEFVDVARIFPRRQSNAHKGNFGHLLIVGGSPGFTGAAIMAARSAMRMGAGLVTVAIPATLNPILEASLLEGMTLVVPGTREGYASPDTAKVILEFAKKVNAVLIGPGLSMREYNPLMIREVLRHIEVPVIIDADGINALAEDMTLLQEIPSAEVILTPHPGEMGRMLQLSSSDIQDNRLSYTFHFAKGRNISFVLKGSGSIIADRRGHIAVNTTGNPGMASGGMGDVLSGMTGALIARGVNGGDALKAAVYLHGAAADLAAKKVGEEALIASDVIDMIPQLLLKIEEMR